MVDVNNFFLLPSSDFVWRKEMWSEMHKLDSPPPKKIVNLCRIVNTEIYSEIKTGVYLYFLNLNLRKV